MVDIAQILSQLNRGSKIAARMAGDQVGDEVLLLADFLVDACVLLAERIVYVAAGLAHHGEHLGADVFGRDLELAADMVLAELAKEGV